MISLKHTIMSPFSSADKVDDYLSRFLMTTAIITVLILLMILVFIFKEAWPVFEEHDWKQLLKESWYPLEGQFGMLSMLWASLAVSAGAILLATPLGLASVIFEQFYAPRWLATCHRLMIALLAGIPSVVFGLWGLTALVPILTKIQPPGTSLLAAVLVLALMILPTITLASGAVLACVPRDLIAGAAALGMSQKSQILGVALPAAYRGIIGAVLLAAARALGETMAVLMVAGNVVQNPSDPFKPVRVLTANIALEMGYATGLHRAGLFTSGLILTALVLILSWLSTRTTRVRTHD
ncbi:MAG: phosphate ABC transporter permease subunit PstC [Gammaproteobacteria bacterium]